MKIKNTQTEKNLKSAFAGESQASIKYQYYALMAQKEGYENVALIFKEKAKNEFEHARLWYKYLNEGDTTTMENLKDAIFGENYEWTDMYEEFSRIAESEGLTEVAKKFNLVGKIENSHEQEFRELLAQLEDSTIFKKSEEVMWKCLNCGYIHIGHSAVDVCPVCSSPKSFFKDCTE